MVKVSVIIPVYNSSITLKRCVDSIINQSYFDIEILLINDGSTDNSQKLIEDYCKVDKRVIGILKKNGGVSSARNVGLENSSGEFITFVDSDDYCDNNYIQRLVEATDTFNVDVVACGIAKENNNGIQLNIPMHQIGVFKSELSVGQAIVNINKSFVYGKLYKNDLVRSNKLQFDERLSMGEDTLFVTSYLCLIEKGIAIISECMYHYVDSNTNSLSKKYYTNLEEVYGKIYDKNLELSRRYNSYKILYPREKLIATMEIQNLYSEYCPLTRKERVNFIMKQMNNNKIRNAFIHEKALGLMDVIRRIVFFIKSPYLLDIVYLFGTRLKKR